MTNDLQEYLRKKIVQSAKDAWDHYIKVMTDLLDPIWDKYYEAPSDKIFNEIKQASKDIWNTYDDTYGYASEKVNRIKDIGNIKDNAMFMVAMFDRLNQRKLLSSLSEEARSFILERIW